MRLASGLLLLLTALSLTYAAGAETRAPADVVSVSAEGTQFRLTLADGRILRSPDLVGATLIIDTGDGRRKIHVAAVERDPDARNGEVWLHTMLVEQPDGSSQNLCEAGPDGRRQGFPLASRVNPDGGTESTPPEKFDIVCTAGARAKCVRFGYRPWLAAEAELYNACTRMVRADYCGQGVGTTRNGMRIDLYDDAKIQVEDNAPAQAFEAGWTSRGAVCVRHVRVKQNTSLDRLRAACPRLAGELGDGCTEAVARRLGARLFNRSAP
jgi:hypothetical protein